MSLLRARCSIFARTSSRLPAATQNLASKRYATGDAKIDSNTHPDVAKTSVDGASGKDTKEAQPKLFSAGEPDQDASHEVQQHNKEVDQRAHKPNEKNTDKDVENDKVEKGFWSGKFSLTGWRNRSTLDGIANYAAMTGEKGSGAQG